MQKFVYRPSRIKNGKRVISRIWWGGYKLDGDTDTTRLQLATSDKRVAEHKLAELVRLAEQERAGILAPRPLRDGAARLLRDHLRDHVADLVALGRSKDYAYTRGVLVERLLDDRQWQLLRDVTPESFTAWREHAKNSKSPKTLNEYRDAARGFLNWMVKQGRAAVNPLANVAKVLTRGRERRNRRALSVAECQRLVAVDDLRGTVYLTALLTGLRRGELAALKWEDLALDREAPCLTVRAATAKNRKAATVYLRADLAERLRALRPATAAAKALVFERIPGMKKFRADLATAGIAHNDESGRVADFHALRHTFCTLLQVSGVPQRVAMQLMRHSDPKLTALTYTDESALPTLGAVERIPSLHSPSTKNAQGDAQELVPARLSLSHGVAHSLHTPRTQLVSAQEERHALSRVVPPCQSASKNWGSRIRT